MNILVLGRGGREHAFCHAFARSPKCDVLYCAPGNAGIARDAVCISSCTGEDTDQVVSLCRKHDIGLVVVGPEHLLTAGVADILRAEGIPVVGPSARAAILESSKAFVKKLCFEKGIPAADSATFDQALQAREYIGKIGAPCVVKADGLAGGKGVTVARTKEEALAAVDACMVENRFGEAGRSVVVEEFLEGEEVSFFALCDGEGGIEPFGSAQDHKAIGEGGTGPNTGGMGAYSPAREVNAAEEEEIMARFIRPAEAAMRERGTPFSGILFAGLIRTAEGLKLLEFNVRMGDPEAQVLLPRLESDPVDVFSALAEGRLSGLGGISWREKKALCVVLATRGYPGSHPKHTAIGNVEAAEKVKNVTVYHAGTDRMGGDWVSAAGRVLNITAVTDTYQEAKWRAYDAVERIDWPEAVYRRDIGRRVLEEEGESDT